MNYVVKQNKQLITKNTKFENITVFEIVVDNNEELNLEIAKKIFKEQIFDYCNFTWAIDDWEGLISIIEDKISKYKNSTNGFDKNDGIILPLITYDIIEKYYNTEILYLMQNISELESNQSGFDSIFLSNIDNSIFMCEYKSSISNLDEKQISDRFIDALQSIFCVDSRHNAKLVSVKKKARLYKNSEKIINNLNMIQVNRKQLENLLDRSNIVTFNSCLISPWKTDYKIDTIRDEIIKNLVKEKYCGNCKKIVSCNKFEKLKIINFVILKLQNEFSLLQFYKDILVIAKERRKCCAKSKNC